ncbi:hypothetical protein BCR33DRAFT_737172 [Rhizoclosmatium globosum]|uniref:Uncharacterized protein n=1 Tax=Rhizoclosmatium globosum TaxID=329046 RepID=A0A1Y2CIF2_9FUNG|nr:hypothetical protein BCR33DRAFT_737172 [Rhizoclosmatium globosum]|eukprot:ORY46085.1 hypothetical protein BCR33DRAFT_737172 [Rhizoclosmatium globosum]
MLRITPIIRRTLFTANNKGNTGVFDYSKVRELLSCGSVHAKIDSTLRSVVSQMSNDQLYANLGKLKGTLPQEEYAVLEERVLAPYRQKNRVLGFGLMTFCGLVFGYAAYRTKTEDFRNIEPLKKD